MVLTLVLTIVGGGGVEALAGAGQMDPLAIAVAGVVAVVYLFVQGSVDRTTALGKAVEKLDFAKVERLLADLNKLPLDEKSRASPLPPERKEEPL